MVRLTLTAAVVLAVFSFTAQAQNQATPEAAKPAQAAKQKTEQPDFKSGPVLHRCSPSKSVKKDNVQTAQTERKRCAG